LKPAGHAPVRALAGALVVLAALLGAAAPASAGVVINEVESDDPVVADYVEIKNVDIAAVDISGYVVKDSDDAHAFTVPGGTIVAANGYYVADVNSGAGAFGLGSGDSARLYDAGAALLDSYSWTSHAAATYGRCPDGTGAMTATSLPTRGAANDCPVAASAWPGGSAVSLADGVSVFGSNLSGLAYQPSGTGARGVLWAVRNGPSTLYRLVYDGTTWTPDTANGWGAGKQLLYPNGTGVPDAEGVTLAGGDATGVYVSTERNDDGANSNTSRPAVLRFDVTSAAVSLSATKDFNLTADLPGLGANAGLEAVTWVPDDLLVSKGFLDESTGVAYAPAGYPDHGAGLFFVGVEQDGRIVAYALNQSTGAFTRVASIASGFPKIMALEYEAESTHLWAVCDDSCNGRSATLDIAQTGPSDGRFVVSNTYERPAGMANLNNEGFAIAPQAECVSALKPAFWSDDGNTDQHALRAGTLNCTVLPAPDTGGTSQTPGTQTPGPVTPGPAPAADLTAPSLAVALKLTRALRRTGKFGVVVTLGEKADLTITATARKTARSKARRILRKTRSGVAAGKRTLALKVTRRVRRSLRKGHRVTITVVARDAAGNAVTRRATKKVP
jgi:hypothetical protein